MKQKLILERLLDKYEQSVHLYHPDVSTRRVMLRVDKKEFPEYDYENASVRDEWNTAARELELQGLVSLEWIKERPVLSRVILNLELLTNSGIVQINLFQICCLLKNGKKKDAWRRHPIYFIIRFKLIAVAERRQ